MKLYVGNLLYNTTEDDLRTLFSQYGTVESVAVITGQQYGGRALTVNEARPKTGGAGGGGRSGGFGGGRDRY